MKKVKAKQATAETLVTITDNLDDILALLQAVAVNSPQFITSPLSLRADKRARIWFCCWTAINLLTPPKPAPQHHMGITDILTGVATRLHIAEAFRLFVADQREVEK